MKYCPLFFYGILKMVFCYFLPALCSLKKVAGGIAPPDFFTLPSVFVSNVCFYLQD
jgi:hypothetical protein